MSSIVQRSYPRDRTRYPQAIGCLMWWGLFSASLAGYLVFFFIMSWYKGELGPGQLCAEGSGASCTGINVIIPIVVFAILFVSQLYMVYLVEGRKRSTSLSHTYGMLVISMLFLPVFGTVVGLYLLVRMARDPQVQAYYRESGS
ncbi:MAG: hypothetical protein JOZ39_10350 [Chloroflexi bacterium]|nr:hypothetical protein [Chloroflexota bacterium]